MIEGEEYLGEELVKEEGGEGIVREERGEKMEGEMVMRYGEEGEMIMEWKVWVRG